MRFQPFIQRGERNRELTRMGRLFGLPQLFDGRHADAIKPLDAHRVHLVPLEAVTGFLVPFAGGLLSATEGGFAAMNRALEERAEDEPAREGIR